MSCSRILQEFPVTVLWPNIPAGPFPCLGNRVSSLFPGNTRLWHWEFTVSKAAPGAGAAGIPCPSECCSLSWSLRCLKKQSWSWVMRTCSLYLSSLESAVQTWVFQRNLSPEQLNSSKPSQRHQELPSGTAQGPQTAPGLLWQSPDCSGLALLCILISPEL